MPSIDEVRSDSLTYYTEQIRAEVLATIRLLKARVENKRYAEEYCPVDPVRAEYVTIGYLINMHHGRDLFSEGDFVDGLRVTIDRNNPRTITVGVDKVEFMWEEEIETCDEDGNIEYTTKVRYQTEDIVESATW